MHLIICISEHWMKVTCLNIQLVPNLKVWMSCYRDMSTFVGTSPFFRRALCVAMETMQFHIAQMGLFFRAIFFPIKGVFQNDLTHIRSFPNDARLV